MVLSILHTKINRKTPALGKCKGYHTPLQLYRDILDHLNTRWMPEGMGHIFEMNPQKSLLLLYSLISCLSPFSHHFSSQMNYLSCPSESKLPFGDFYRPYHSPISYVPYLEKVLPETAIPFDTPQSACCWSPQALGEK